MPPCHTGIESHEETDQIKRPSLTDLLYSSVTLMLYYEMFTLQHLTQLCNDQRQRNIHSTVQFYHIENLRHTLDYVTLAEWRTGGTAQLQ